MRAPIVCIRICIAFIRNFFALLNTDNTYRVYLLHGFLHDFAFCFFIGNGISRLFTFLFPTLIFLLYGYFLIMLLPLVSYFGVLIIVHFYVNSVDMIFCCPLLIVFCCMLTAKSNPTGRHYL